MTLENKMDSIAEMSIADDTATLSDLLQRRKQLSLQIAMIRNRIATANRVKEMIAITLDR